MLVLGFYTGLLGLIAIWLKINVIRKRRAEKIYIGDQNNIKIIRAMRGQSNFTENVPLALILIFLAVSAGMPTWGIHILAGLLVIGRFLHAHHFTRNDASGWTRRIGTLLTMLVLIVTSWGLVIHLGRHLI